MENRSLPFLGLFCCIWICQISVAQHTAIHASFERDTIAIENGHSFSNRLRITNQTSTKVRLYLDRSLAAVTSSYLPLPDSIELSAGEQRDIPVKYLATADLIKTPVQPFIIRYFIGKLPVTDSLPPPGYNMFPGAYGHARQRTNIPFAGAIFRTTIQRSGRIVIRTSEPTLYLDPQINQANLHCQILNEGFFAQPAHLTISAYPDGLSVIPSEETFLLAARTQRMINCDIRQQVRKNFSTDFVLRIQVRNDSGMVIASTDVRVAILSANKQMALPAGPSANSLDNCLGLTYVNLNRQLSYYQLHGEGSLNVAGHGLLSYGLTLEYYTKPHGFNAYNTWVAYTNKNFGIKAGNITDNLDYAIIGRGVQATAKVNDRSTVDIYAVQNNYLLFSQVLQSLPGADILAARYSLTSKPNSIADFQLSYLHARDPVLGVYTNMLHSNAKIRMKPNQDLRIEGGLSAETLLDHSKTNYGFALGAYYRGNFQRWLLSFSNYGSSSYYSGFRRGTIQLEDQAEYKLSQGQSLGQSVFLRYAKTDNSPKYAFNPDSIPLTQYNYNNATYYEGGYRLRIKKISMVVRPYLMDQQLYTTYYKTPVILNSSSKRLALDLNYITGNHALYMSTDYGLTRSDSARQYERNYPSLRMTGNYLYRFVYFNWLLQDHAYYLTDELQPGGSKNFRIYSFGPGVHYPFLNNQLVLSGRYYASYYSFTHAWTQTIEAGLNYNLRRNWSILGQVFYNHYQSNTFNYPDYTQIRIGVNKHFLSTDQAGLVRLRLTLFEDKNSNGNYDPPEQLVQHVIVLVDGTPAISNAKGVVEFAGLSRGMHTIIVDGNKGWNLREPLTIPIYRSMKLALPLVQSGKLTGRVIIRKQKYERVEPNLEGIRITARDEKGKTYSTLTDDQGVFSFFLPVNRYDIFIQSGIQSGPGGSDNGTSLSMVTTETSKEVMVTSGDNKEVRLEVQDRRRKIEIKQF